MKKAVLISEGRFGLNMDKIKENIDSRDGGILDLIVINNFPEYQPMVSPLLKPILEKMSLEHEKILIDSLKEKDIAIGNSTIVISTPKNIIKRVMNDPKIGVILLNGRISRVTKYLFCKLSKKRRLKWVCLTD